MTRNELVSTVGVSTIVFTFIALLIFSLLLGYPLKWLWNALVPCLFHGPTITFWQAVGLRFLTGFFQVNVSGSKSQ